MNLLNSIRKFFGSDGARQLRLVADALDGAHEVMSAAQPMADAIDHAAGVIESQIPEAYKIRRVTTFVADVLRIVGSAIASLKRLFQSFSVNAPALQS